jgi:phosphohistidine phosphatase
MLKALPDHVSTALVIGHAPGVPGVLYELIEPADADPDEWAKVEFGFAPSALAALNSETTWADLDRMSLSAVHS